LVVVPEPTSVENTYRFIKSAFLRRVGGLLGPNLSPVDRAFEGGIPSPLDIYQFALLEQPAIADKLLEEIQRFRPRVVVNQTRTRADLDLGAQLRSAGRRRLGVGIDYLGHLDSDDAVWVAVRKKQPLVVEHPESKAAKCIERIARKLASADQDRQVPMAPPRGTEDQSLYEVLEIGPGASDEEIRRAVKRSRDIFARDSMVVAGLFAQERLELVQRRIDEAHDTLLDADRRREYDLALFPDGIPSRATPTPPSGLSARQDETPPPIEIPEPEIRADTEFTGDLLRRVREARQIGIVEIAQRTKINAQHLRSIEDERWSEMPAPVYLRGWLVEYARILRLDVPQVTRTFLERYRKARRD
jgi:flagellar biosynthesis protein FlhG